MQSVIRVCSERTLNAKQATARHEAAQAELGDRDRQLEEGLGRDRSGIWERD